MSWWPFGKKSAAPGPQTVNHNSDGSVTVTDSFEAIRDGGVIRLAI